MLKMKISVLTATYNRGGLLKDLYTSLLVNLKFDVEVEWLIMDDGSSDNTKKVVEDFARDKMITIQYFWQKNQGKMVAINNLVPKATGDVVIECDSDDYFCQDAFKIIREEYEKCKEKEGIYAFCFEKIEKTTGKMMSERQIPERTTLFDLYFKQDETGEKALVFLTEIRKSFSYPLEGKERFVTEARMYHQMDLEYAIICIPKPIMVCQYQQTGYTKNIQKVFKENPLGYYAYFQEIFNHPMQGVTFSKWMYAIKHYILFSNLTKEKHPIRKIRGWKNKLAVVLLWVPGSIKTRVQFQ